METLKRWLIRIAIDSGVLSCLSKELTSDEGILEKEGNYYYWNDHYEVVECEKTVYSKAQERLGIVNSIIDLKEDVKNATRVVAISNRCDNYYSSNVYASVTCTMRATCSGNAVIISDGNEKVEVEERPIKLLELCDHYQDISLVIKELRKKSDSYVHLRRAVEIMYKDSKEWWIEYKTNHPIYNDWWNTVNQAEDGGENALHAGKSRDRKVVHTILSDDEVRRLPFTFFWDWISMKDKQLRGKMPSMLGK